MLREPPDNAPDWAWEGYRLITQQRLSQAEAARRIGKHRRSLLYWIKDGEADRQAKKNKDWRKKNPERVRELSRHGNRRRRREKGDEVRAAQRAWDANPVNRGRCTSCGGLRGIGVYSEGTCMGCVKAAAEEKRQQIVRLWREGKSLKEIAAILGYQAKALGPLMVRMRKRGYDLPYRRTVR